MRAVPPKPIRAPELPARLECLAPERLESGALIEQCRIEGGAFSGSRCDSIRLEEVHIAACAFDDSKLTNVKWRDVLCERSTFSMIDWRGAAFTRAEVHGCRLTGGKLVEAQLDDVRFIECHFDYGSFIDARLSRVAFESCHLREADFRGADLTGTSFVDCNLERADFSRARLRRADVSRSTVTGMTAGPADVRGLVVSREQACSLAVLFGLIVRD
ncbi:MAG: pentapeptide repeat-containing protein [Polyangiaceae bacterium]|jgi:uncharacterized protein YjbI with pentapeptide repeats